MIYKISIRKYHGEQAYYERGKDIGEMIREDLCGTGCSQTAEETICRLYEAKQYDELIRYLRVYRCECMEKMHAVQRNVDCIDQVIRAVRKDQERTETV